MGVNRIAGASSSRIDSILLLQFSSAFNAGIVGAARQLANAVLILLSSFATVIAPRFSSYQGINLKKYFKKTILFSILLSLGVCLGIFLVEPITLLFGPKYSQTAGVLSYLLVGLIPFALSAPAVNALIYSFKKPMVIGILSVIQFPLIFLGNWYLIPILGIYAPVLVIGLWNLSTLLVASIFVHFYFKDQ
jgi:O-antigen/teichoic acid export membrane protein